MKTSFPLFSSPISMGQHLWKQLISSGDIIIDATMGNGKDTLVIGQILSSLGEGTLFSLDIQEKALENTKALLEEHLPNYSSFVHLLLTCHTAFPKEIKT
ncbi:MAG: rRNA methyltransferase, partial [Chlamydiia bacterium]|nr:rRNA methyltransferase [Chlamydiia bacterium]